MANRKALFLLLASAAFLARNALGQSFGVELHNTAMPASGGMAGVSIARPQDVGSAINGNPASLAQFRGTQFMFGGFWAEPTFDLQHDGGLFGNVGTFAAKSNAQGSVGGNIGVTQDLTSLGIPATLGIGLLTGAGAGVDFRDVPASDGTSSSLMILQMTTGLGVQLNDRLSAGASISLGTSFFDGPFVGVSAMCWDYALRGAVGLNYEVDDDTTVGVYYQTKQSFNFDNAIQLELLPNVFDPISRDVAMDLPDNIGFGIANRSLIDGRLLLAVDVLYKQWDNADLFRSIYDNQWVFQAGAQYAAGKCRYRLGYAYAQNPMQDPPGLSAGGITPPGGLAAMYYLQAQLAAISPHRLTAGVGVVDLLPGVDFDVAAGGMFEGSQDFGAATSASLASYWFAAGLTWRFHRGACPCGR